MFLLNGSLLLFTKVTIWNNSSWIPSNWFLEILLITLIKFHIVTACASIISLFLYCFNVSSNITSDSWMSPFNVFARARVNFTLQIYKSFWMWFFSIISKIVLTTPIERLSPCNTRAFASIKYVSSHASNKSSILIFLWALVVSKFCSKIGKISASTRLTTSPRLPIVSNEFNFLDFNIAISKS